MKIEKFNVESVNELAAKTPKNFVSETDKLMVKAEKQLSELKVTLNELERKSHMGEWYFSGMMQNEYGIKKIESVRELYEQLNSGVNGNTIYTLREISKYLGWNKNAVEKIKKIKLTPDKK